jgi:DNA adenine methylase
MRSWTSWSGRGAGSCASTSRSPTSPAAAGHPGGRRRSTPTAPTTLTNRLEACAGRLRRVHLEPRPAVEVIAKYAKPGADAVVYRDPPYLATVRSLRTKRPGLDYAVEYATKAEHRELAEVLCATPAAVLLSGYPSELYAELYEARGWWRAERQVTRPTSNTSGGRGALVVEAVWSNRPLASQPRLLDQEEATAP